MHSSFYEILISKALSNEASADEIVLLENWLNESSENRRVYEECRLICNNQPIDSVSFDVMRAFSNIEPKLKKKSSSYFRFTHVSIAASFLIIVALVIFYFNTKQKFPASDREWLTFTSGHHEHKTFKLNDGSIIYLNAESRLKCRKSFAKETIREIFLEGEAFFEVAHDSLRPFIVKTSEISTRVLGTSFNIDSKNGITKVSVATGSVRVNFPDSDTTLSPNQRFTYQSDTQKWWIDQVENDNVSAWRSGILIFEDTRMDSAAVVLEKWYDTKIYFQDIPIRKCRITGRFKDETLNHVLDAIREATGIEFTMANNEVKLMGTQCK